MKSGRISLKSVLALAMVCAVPLMASSCAGKASSADKESQQAQEKASRKNNFGSN